MKILAVTLISRTVLTQQRHYCSVAEKEDEAVWGCGGS